MSYPSCVEQSSVFPDIPDHIKKTIDEFTASNTNIGSILKLNQLETIIPFNLWFNHPKYKFIHLVQNGQHLRARYFDGSLLTPIVEKEKKSNNLKNIQPILGNLCIYQPFYPETFFSSWELFKTEIIGPTKVIYIGYKHGLGLLESFMIYHENPEINYDYLLIEKCSTLYLDQFHSINNISEISSSYDYVLIDCRLIKKNLFESPNPETDLNQSLKYIMKCVQHSASIIYCAIDLVCSTSWFILLEILSLYYETVEFIRPEIVNQCNPLLFIKASNKLKTKLHKKFSNIVDSTFNFVGKLRDSHINFIKLQNQWCSSLNTIIKKSIDQWYSDNNLIKISDLHSINQEFEMFNMRLIQTDTDHTYPQSIKKLNFLKRVMDTKPSNIFGCPNNRDEYLTWEQLSSSLNPYGAIKHYLKQKIDKKLITNAWVKLYEILVDHGKTEPDIINSFSICEAPGAFLSSLEYWGSRTNRKINWYAQTLKPSDDNTALDDHYGIIKNHHNKWIFGDYNGDITNPETIKYYANHHQLQNINLMTADGGIALAPNELNNQKNIMYKLTLGQIICILAVLSTNGIAILKTFIPIKSTQIFDLLATCFEEIIFCKPPASHSSNSEIYVVLKGYKKISDSIIDKLYDHLIDHTNPIPISMRTNINNIISKLADKQIISLLNYYYYYYNHHNKNTPNIQLLNKWQKKNLI